MVTRRVMFLVGCIGSRVALTGLAFYLGKHGVTPLLGLPPLQWLALGFVAVAIAMLYFFATGTRTTGPEVMGGAIWWNWLRPIHALLYLVFAYMAMQPTLSVDAWKCLAADTTLGLVAFLAKSPAAKI
jgi:hypothetical protein